MSAPTTLSATPTPRLKHPLPHRIAPNLGAGDLIDGGRHLDLDQRIDRIQRLFLGWSDYDDSSGYENFGWWDLQGDPENADQEEADEIDLDPDSDDADDFAECLSPYE